MNKKISLLDALEKYKGKDFYVSFTGNLGAIDSVPFPRGSNAGGNKIGINPQSSYDTPMGIYSYPVDYVLRTRGVVEFAGNEPFAQVFKPKDGIKILYLNEVNDKDVENASIKFGITPNEFLVNSPAGKLWSVLFKYSNDLVRYNGFRPNMAFWRALKELGFDAVVDYDPVKGEGSGVIHINEPTQAVFLSRSSIEHIETIHNIRPRASEHPTLVAKKIKSGEYDFSQHIDSFIDGPSHLVDPLLDSDERIDDLISSRYFDLLINNQVLSPENHLRIMKRSKMRPEKYFDLLLPRDISEEMLKYYIANAEYPLGPSEDSLYDRYPHLVGDMVRKWGRHFDTIFDKVYSAKTINTDAIDAILEINPKMITDDFDGRWMRFMTDNQLYTVLTSNDEETVKRMCMNARYWHGPTRKMFIERLSRIGLSNLVKYTNF